MRPSLWIKLTPLVLFAGLLAPSGASAAPAAPPGARPDDRSWVVEGYGDTKKLARDDAVDEALLSVDKFLAEKYGDLGWTPTKDFLIQEHIVQLDEPQEGTFDRFQGYKATARVDLGDASLRKMQPEVDRERKRVREQVQTQRHYLVARLLGALVALFLVVVGYLRLEDLTRGYYTTLLRLGAAAVVVLTVAGLFLLV